MTIATKPVTAETRFPSSPEAVGLVRRFAASMLSSDEFDARQAVDVVELLLSELVTNVVRHTQTDLIIVVLLRDAVGVRVAVRDSSDAVPVRRTPDSDDDGGRGLLLVDALADEWCVEKHPEGGKTVWAVVSVQRPVQGDVEGSQ
ncbi:ATP-binding protein [Streptacidiphilus sp. EB103A]|uniref:ATP-binding protein n=1 Tax=Streptacidiphilus sp. EB103A TaxID=3156275 RepID=UPI00351763F1